MISPQFENGARIYSGPALPEHLVPAPETPLHHQRIPAVEALKVTASSGGSQREISGRTWQ